MAKEIPGFYFDEEKQKYFKIQPNHVAPKGSRYSKDAISIENEARLKRKRDVFYLAQQRTRIQHSRILGHLWGGSFSLQKELGNVTSANTAGGHRSWARGLEKSKLIEEVQPSEISQFVVDEATGLIIYERHGATNKRTSLHACVPGEGNKWVPKYTPVTYGLRDKITSFSISPCRTVLAATLDGGITLIKLVAPEVYDSLFLGPECYSQNNISPVVDDSASVVLESTTDTSYWASAARNSPTVACFAVATTQGILLVEQNPDTWVQNRHTDFKSSDTLAVDWLDQNVVISGARNGQIRLWDTRNNGTSTRMFHPSCTTHARRLNEHMIVVAGLMHQLRVYDLRFPAERTPGALTTPYMTFPTYKNWANIPPPGLDVCQNLIAAGSSDACIQIFDFKSGEELKVGEDPVGLRCDRLPYCLRFQSDTGGTPEGLLYSDRRLVNKLGWS